VCTVFINLAVFASCALHSFLIVSSVRSAGVRHALAASDVLDEMLTLVGTLDMRDAPVLQRAVQVNSKLCVYLSFCLFVLFVVRRLPFLT